MGKNPQNKKTRHVASCCANPICCFRLCRILPRLHSHVHANVRCPLPSPPPNPPRVSGAMGRRGSTCPPVTKSLIYGRAMFDAPPPPPKSVVWDQGSL